MKKLLLFLFLILCTGCTSSHTAAPSYNEIDIEMKTNPTDVSLNQSTQLQFKVHANGKLVDSADVKVHIQKGDHGKIEKITPKQISKGSYSLKKVFSDPVLYHFTIYTQINDTTEIATKEIDLRKKASTKQENSDHSLSSNRQQNHSSNKSSDFFIHIMKDDVIKANQETKIMAHLMKKNGLVTDAKVQFEYFQNGSSKHKYVDAKVRPDGAYEAKIKLTKGTYTLICHVEKDKLHAHEQSTLTAQ
ncbi:FixH family protein [Neobacillus drentensis]|uniref:FixH family protein n=1 Tax=Neobacillus drentensis TaxID=220684 RepID=UPI003000282E